MLTVREYLPNLPLGVNAIADKFCTSLRSLWLIVLISLGFWYVIIKLAIKAINWLF
jgi:hypothetical protein